MPHVGTPKNERKLTNIRENVNNREFRVPTFGHKFGQFLAEK